MKPLPTGLLCAPLALLACCAAHSPAAQPSRAAPRSVALYESRPFFTQEGIASWYGGRWIGRLTANGERYRAGDLTAAHKTLPFNTRVVVTDLKTGRQVTVRINNRGPHVRGRIIDLSVAAARQLGMYERGLAKVRIEAFKKIPLATRPNLRLPPKPSPGENSPQQQKRPRPSEKKTPPRGGP